MKVDMGDLHPHTPSPHEWGPRLSSRKEVNVVGQLEGGQLAELSTRKASAPGSGGQLPDPKGCPRAKPVGRAVVHGGRDQARAIEPPE